MDRRIARTFTTAAPAPGFAGAGHTAVEVVSPAERELNDPFLLLMDDRIEDRRGARIGAAHPHAGQETVTLLLEGTIGGTLRFAMDFKAATATPRRCTQATSSG